MKSSRISKTNATIIEHINTSNFLEADKKQEYENNDIEDLFTILLISKTTMAHKHSA